MIETAQKSATIITEAFMYRHHPQTIAIQNAIQAGEIGKIQLIRGSFSFIFQRPDDFRWIPEYGGGALWDVGCYPVNFALVLAGAYRRKSLDGRLSRPVALIKPLSDSFVFPTTYWRNSIAVSNSRAKP